MCSSATVLSENAGGPADGGEARIEGKTGPEGNVCSRQSVGGRLHIINGPKVDGPNCDWDLLNAIPHSRMRAPNIEWAKD